MVSAACPGCRILLVETNSLGDQDLAQGLTTAVSMGAVAISNSYGGSESKADAQMEPYYTHPGILVTVSAGDSGYGAEYPATSAGVVAVGGTSLAKSSSSRGWAETVWNDGQQGGATGSGCSSNIPKPAWQTDTGCTRRTEADVSALADPDTGVTIYCGGWQEGVGGTSAASPIIAGAFTNLGVVTPSTWRPQWIWENTGDFYDVTSGNNGTCTQSYLCTAGKGYDGPTGWGSPNGSLIAMMTTGGSSSSSGSSSGSSSSGGSGSSSGVSASSGGSSSGSVGASSSGGSNSSSGGLSSSGGKAGGGSSSSSGAAPCPASSGSSSGVGTAVGADAGIEPRRAAGIRTRLPRGAAALRRAPR